MAYIPKKKNEHTTPAPVRKAPPQTSWGSVADWYDTYLEVTPDSYQAMVIAPNLLRVLALQKGERVLDVACGQGYFTRSFVEAGALAEGTDISRELITRAKKRSPKIPFYNTSAHQLQFAKDASYDVVTIILAIQNIENIVEVFAEARRVLKPTGRLVVVMNHPAFRIPKRTSWGWDDVGKIQFRRTDGYLSAATISIDMHPGKMNSPKTISYHRSLQDFFKALSKSGFAVTKLEEWISHKKSEKGPKQIAEDTARKEIPLFLMMECRAM